MKHPLLSVLHLNVLSEQMAVQEILSTNEQSQEYGLTLSPRDAKELAAAKSELLRSHGRVEIGGGTLEKIITAFCDSSYLWQSNYTETLHELLDTFYYMKNETMDQIPDDELIGLMKEYFETSCAGSVDLLQGRELDQIVRNIHLGVESDRQPDDEDEDPDDDFDGRSPGSDEWM